MRQESKNYATKCQKYKIPQQSVKRKKYTKKCQNSKNDTTKF